MRRTTQAGFTLLELLTALVVLGLLMVAITQGVRFGVQAWQIQGRTLHQRDDMDAVDRTLRTMIAHADPGGFLQRAPAFVGTARSLSFTTALPIAAEASFARPADVMLRTDGAHRLVLLWLPHYSDPIGAARAPRRSACCWMGVDHIEIGYWQSGPTGGGWLPTWNNPTLPKLIRVHIVFVAAALRHWPDIVVAPMRDRWRL